MAKTKDSVQVELYETKCDFQFEDGRAGVYRVFSDRYQTTCRRCLKTITQKVAEAKSLKQKKRIENAIADPDSYLMNELCGECWRAEQEIEKELEQDIKQTSYSNRAGVGQAINLAALTGKSPKDIPNLDKIVEDWVVYCENKQIQHNG